MSTRGGPARRLLCLAFAASALAAPPADEPPASQPAGKPPSADRAPQALEDVEREIAERFSKVQSVRARIEVVSEYVGAGGNVRRTTRGTYEYRRAGERVMFRVDTQSHTLITGPGTASGVEGRDLMVGDGEFVYQLSEQGNHKAAARARQRPDNVYAISVGFLAGLRDRHELRLLAPETEDGQERYVIEARAKAAAPASAQKPEPDDPARPAPEKAQSLVYFFDRQTGVLLRVIKRDAEGHVVHSVTFRDVETNVEIPAERFLFNAPDDVPVIDADEAATTRPGAPDGATRP